MTQILLQNLKVGPTGPDSTIMASTTIPNSPASYILDFQTDGPIVLPPLLCTHLRHCECVFRPLYRGMGTHLCLSQDRVYYHGDQRIKRFPSQRGRRLPHRSSRRAGLDTR